METIKKAAKCGKGNKEKSDTLKSQGQNILWENICDEYLQMKNLILEYIKEKDNQPKISYSPTVQFMVDNVFPVLKPAMKVMLEKAVENDSCYIPKTVFDGVDFLCEYLYYENPNHPERKENIVPLHELEWVKKSLKESPRPFYPKHRIWKKEYGALIIQCWFRGHTVRSRPEVQEVRQFWRTLEKPLVVDETEIPESITETGLNESL